MRQRIAWVVLIAVLLILAACKGESPTAPPSGGGGPPTPPPSGVNVVLTTTNTDPLVSSSVTITATVTQNGTPVPNGTAVEFVTSGGFLDTSSTSIIKTTTGGVATVRLSASTAGPIRVTATVNNVTRTIDVTFRSAPVEPTPPGTDPTIISVDPPVGPPAGGTVVRIRGANFKPPVRVLFDLGGPQPVEAFVNSVNAAETEIQVVTPSVNLGAGQQLEATVIVITQAGTTTERRAELVDGFIYRNEALTPVIFTVTPNSGPVTGGTRVSILGEGFQDPVQVLFNTAEARVLTVKFGEILVETPAGRDTAPDGSGTVVGPVSVTVRNIRSNTATTMADGFFYKAAMQITVAGPTAGSFTGGTRVTIDGIGFLPPVTVVVRTGEGDIGLQPISVSGTRIVAITPGVLIENCEDRTGAIVVTNVNNGDQAEGPEFRFFVPPPIIVNVSPATVTVGMDPSITVTVANAQPGVNRILIGDKTVFPTSTSIDPTTGVGTFVVPLPTNFEFPTEECGVGGERLAPIDVDVTYENANTGCEDTANDALTVNPPDTTCVFPPAPEANVLAPPAGPCPRLLMNAGNGNQGTITIENTGNAPLEITAAATPATAFQVFPATETVPPGESRSFIVTFLPAGGDAVGNVTFTTNDVDEATINVCIEGDAP